MVALSSMDEVDYYKSSALLRAGKRVKTNQAEWLCCDDVSSMLKALRSSWPGSEAELELELHRYLLACCRRIWRLLPGDAIRMAIEVAERYLDGQATARARDAAADLAEHEYFNIIAINSNYNHVRIQRWLDEIAKIPRSKLRRLVRTSLEAPEFSPREILVDAAAFAFRVVHYESLFPKESIVEYARLLSAHLLRERFDNPFVLTPDR